MKKSQIIGQHMRWKQKNAYNIDKSELRAYKVQLRIDLQKIEEDNLIPNDLSDDKGDKLIKINTIEDDDMSRGLGWRDTEEEDPDVEGGIIEKEDEGKELGKDKDKEEGEEDEEEE
ncbi:hypothetical protein EV426DRAFT_578853 [Tirmania nivea]|nr:hypothetical protein EV426DRAFT_578853 [Tirmania nivea]